MDLGLKSEVEKQKHKHECELPSSTVKTRERGSQGRRRARGRLPQGPGAVVRRSTEELRAKERVSVGQGSGTTPPAGAAVGVATGSPSAPSSPSGCASPAQAHPGPTLRPGAQVHTCVGAVRSCAGAGNGVLCPAPALGPGPSCPWKLSPPCPHCRSPGDPAQGALSLAALSTPAVPGTTDGQRAGPQLDTSGRLLRCARRLNIHKHSPAGKEDSKPRKG